MRTAPSPEAREVTNAILDDTFGRLVADVAAARRLAPEKVKAAVDLGILGSEQAKAEGLVDAVLWPDELEGWVRRIAGRSGKLIAEIGLGRYSFTVESADGRVWYSRSYSQAAG